CYDILKSIVKVSRKELHDFFGTWNTGELLRYDEDIFEDKSKGASNDIKESEFVKTVTGAWLENVTVSAADWWLQITVLQWVSGLSMFRLDDKGRDGVSSRMAVIVLIRGFGFEMFGLETIGIGSLTVGGVKEGCACKWLLLDGSSVVSSLGGRKPLTHPGTPPHDVIEEMATTIVTTMDEHGVQMATSEAATPS
ncbi:hypothetical protein Tco_1274260, partial [Tanacetum coccineum]